MQIAIISDIHGNQVALSAVLDDIGQQKIDQLVCLGDVAAFGPQPREALSLLKETNCPVVMGNTDAWLLDPRPHKVRNKDTRRVEEIERWAIDQLTLSDIEYMRSFQQAVTFPLCTNHALMCFHGSPRSNTDIILASTEETELERMLTGFRATTMAGGHTHVQMLRRFQDKILINPGSVGLPHEHQPDTDRVINPPWAEYAIVSCGVDQPTVAFRRVSYDVNPLIEFALRSSMPYTEWWIKDWIID